MSESSHRRKVSKEFKQQIIDEFINSSLSVKELCLKYDIKESTFRWWGTTNKELHDVLISKSQIISKKPRYTFDQRKNAVEAYLKSGMTYTAFGKVYGVSTMTISTSSKVPTFSS